MKFFLFLLGLLFSLPIFSQKDSIKVFGHIADAFTGAIIEDGTIDVLSPDSTVLFSGEWVYNTDDDVRTASLYYCKIPEEGNYILRLQHPNYFPLYFPITVKLGGRNNGVVSIPQKALMRKRPKEQKLGETVVRATKIKMVMKGDTLVYNADAFQLSHGSMLDALIEQLPGAQLNESGVITVNGKRVSSLLVNGRDFFRGDPKIALENLPAYMVNKVKVYEQQSDFEEMTGLKEVERPLVMDVNLKRQYSIGWIANAEAARGTKDKYLMRLFALRFSDLSRLAIFGSINNTNDTRRPGAKGEWSPSYLPQGLQTSKTAGVEYSYENRHKTFEWTSNVDVTHTNNYTLTTYNHESFLPTQRSFSLSRSEANNHTTWFNTSHRFSLKKAVRQSGQISFNYDKNTNDAMQRAGEVGINPFELVPNGEVLDELFRPGSTRLQQLARNRRYSLMRGNGENWRLSAPYQLRWSPFQQSGVNDFFSFNFSGVYDRHRAQTFDHYRLEYLGAGSGTNDFRNRYRSAPSHHYNFNTEASYLMPFGAFWPTLSYKYSQDYRDANTSFYRLDRLAGWGANTDFAPGMLPSATADMMQALDAPNSGHSRLWQRRHQVSLRLEYRTKHQNRTTIALQLPLRWELEHLLFDKVGQHFDRNRTQALFSPQVYLHQQFQKGETSHVFILNYSLSRAMPDFIYALELEDSSNPLYIQRGNAHLVPSTTQNLSFTMNTFKKKRKLYDLNLSYQRTSNALATERTYNPATGGYVTHPVNVNGNWRTDGTFSTDGQFGANKAFDWSSHSSFSYDHNVDMANVVGSTTHELSTIGSLYLRERLSVNYSQRGWHLGAKVQGSYNRMTGQRSDFKEISAWDYSYGLTARLPLPGKVGLSTDFTVFSRRGYTDTQLNTNHFIWNLRLERSILHGNLTFALDGFDLLHELSNVTRTVNAQGRTEIYHNVIPSYFMLHAIYKFNLSPKTR